MITRKVGGKYQGGSGPHFKRRGGERVSGLKCRLDRGKQSGGQVEGVKASGSPAR